MNKFSIGEEVTSVVKGKIKNITETTEGIRYTVEENITGKAWTNVAHVMEDRVEKA